MQSKRVSYYLLTELYLGRLETGPEEKTDNNPKGAELVVSIFELADQLVFSTSAIRHKLGGPTMFSDDSDDLTTGLI